MTLLFLNYMNTSLPTLLRSLQLAKGTSDQGHKVVLCFMNPAFSPPTFFFELIQQYTSGNLSIRYRRCPAPAMPESPDKITTDKTQAGKITECKPRLLGLFKQMIGSLRYFPKELSLFREIKPDVVVARPDHILSFVFSCRWMGIPLVLDTDGPVEELDDYWDLPSKWIRPFDTWRARRAQAILYISEVCGALWRGKGFANEALFLCPNGADPDCFKPLLPKVRGTLRKRFGFDESAVIGFFGNQRRYHGVGSLIRAALPLLQEDASLKILVIGPIEDRKAIEVEGVPSEWLQKRIVFTGLVSYAEMPGFIDLADIHVMPYPSLRLFHFSPMKMFESLAMGKIIVASDQGQIATLLSALDSACLYTPHPIQTDSLTCALRRGLVLFQSETSGTSGRNLLIREHTWFHRGEVIVRACLHAMEQKHRTAFPMEVTL